jgi:hypothetical protein
MVTYHDYSEDDVKSVLLDKDANCDSGRKLRIVLDALVDANLQDSDEYFETDQEYERVASAKLFLFKLATALTNGHRDKPDVF